MYEWNQGLNPDLSGLSVFVEERGLRKIQAQFFCRDHPGRRSPQQLGFLLRPDSARSQILRQVPNRILHFSVEVGNRALRCLYPDNAVIATASPSAAGTSIAIAGSRWRPCRWLCPHPGNELKIPAMCRCSVAAERSAALSAEIIRESIHG